MPTSRLWSALLVVPSNLKLAWLSADVTHAHPKALCREHCVIGNALTCDTINDRTPLQDVTNTTISLFPVNMLYLAQDVLLKISIAYFVALLFGFVSTAIIAKWMASTYGARLSLGIHYAVVTIVAAPLVVGSIIHLYPDMFINVLVLVPALIWSMYLLYKGLPIVLRISPERGMLMASSLIGYLLVAFVCLLGVMVLLWGRGFGPPVGI